jgi:hypothetical protein
MSLQLPFRLTCAVVGGLILGAAQIQGQTQARFQATSREVVGSAPGLQIVTVRDSMLNACYTVFVIDASSVASPAPAAANIEDAARERDQRLSDLSAEFEHGLLGGVPATLTANPLRYQWEANKAQSDYERVVRQAEMARLSDQIAQLASAPRIAVAGPTACEKPSSAAPRSEK